MNSPCSFSKKNGPIMPLGQNPHQTRFGCVGFSMYACRFCVPQMRQFCLFTYINKIRGGHNALTHRKFKDFFEIFNSEYGDLLLYTEFRWLTPNKPIFFIFYFLFILSVYDSQKLNWILSSAGLPTQAKLW